MRAGGEPTRGQGGVWLAFLLVLVCFRIRASEKDVPTPAGEWRTYPITRASNLLWQQRSR